MRICLITPGHLSTNPRLVKEADALTQAGHDVTVVAANYQAWSGEADREYAARRWRRAPPVEFGPGAPFGRRVSQFARREAGRMLFSAGLRRPSLVAAACHPAAPDLASVALSIPADLYIAHYIAALPAASTAARRHGALYAFDAEDFHSGEFRDDGLDQALVMEIEQAFLGGCAWITAASPGIAEAYAESYGVNRPTVLLNVFPMADAPSASTSCGNFQPGPSLYWFSQTIGPDRGLETAVRAMARARSRPHLVLRGRSARGYVDALERLAVAEGVSGRLHWLPTASPAEMVRLAAQHDVGLSAETGHTRNRQIALTNKLFTYLLAGVATVMSDIEAHRRIAGEISGAALLYRCDDPDSLAEAVDRLLLNRDGLAQARYLAFCLGQEKFNWDYEKAGLINLVEDLESARPL